MKNKHNNDSGVTLWMLVFLVIMAACPPIGVVLLLCIVLSDGTVPGFLGCLTYVVFFVVLAAIYAAIT